MADKQKTYLVIGQSDKETKVRLARAYSPEEAVSIVRRIYVLHDWDVWDLETTMPVLHSFNGENPFP